MTISATEADWSREAIRGFWDPSRKLLKSIRDYQSSRGLRRRFAILRHRFWSVITGADIPIVTSIGGGLILPHPNGIVIHPKAVIGPNCILFQQVTLGTNNGRVPTLHGHVDVGPGAKILGGITIGEHAVIGANAVAIKDVAPGMVAVGIPAKEIRAREQS